jgi:hypothetical protein
MYVSVGASMGLFLMQRKAPSEYGRKDINMYTKHALKRCQQRAIPQELCELVLDYGESCYDKHGARIWFLTKKTIQKLEQTYGSDVRKKLERKRNLFVVESLDTNSVITVGYGYQPSKSVGRFH